MRHDHDNSFNGTFPGAKAASDAGLLIRHIRAPVGVILICHRQVKTVNRTGFDAYPAGHAGHFIEPRFFPQRSFYHGRGDSKGVLHRSRRADASARTALNTPLGSNDVKHILTSRYCINRAKLLACAAAVTLIRNPICHVLRHGVLNG